MSRLTVSQRIRIVRLGFLAACAESNVTHVTKLAKYATLPHEWASLPNSVQACEDIGRRAFHELLQEEKAS